MITLADLAQAADAGVIAPLPDGPWARDIREHANVTATACAAAVGVSEQAWQRYERQATKRFTPPIANTRAGRVLRYLAESSEAAP